MGSCFSTPQSELAYNVFALNQDKVTIHVKILLDNPPPQKIIDSPGFKKRFYYSAGGAQVGGNKSAIGWACFRGNDSLLKEVVKLPYLAKTAVVDFDTKTGASSIDDVIHYFDWYLSHQANEETSRHKVDALNALDCLKILLKQNPELNEKAVNRINPRTDLPPLLAIASITRVDNQYPHEICVELLANGADASFFSPKFKTTALHEASKGGNHFIVGEILSNNNLKADDTVNRKDGNGSTPLCLAAENGHVECFSLLLGARDVDVDVINDKGFSVLDHCILNYRVKSVFRSSSTSSQVDMKPMLQALLFSSKTLPKIDDGKVTDRLRELSKVIGDASESIAVGTEIRKMIDEARARKEGNNGVGRISVKEAQSVL